MSMLNFGPQQSRTDLADAIVPPYRLFWAITMKYVNTNTEATDLRPDHTGNSHHALSSLPPLFGVAGCRDDSSLKTLISLSEH